RCYSSGKISGDRLGLAEESAKLNEITLLELFMDNGQLVKDLDTLESIQQRTRQEVSNLPELTRQITNPQTLAVTLSADLDTLRNTLIC
ncbi:MAG: hypothetical protein RLZZ148_3063, partial [Cyanobacteriota bacterium]